jgi:hypothetical protein
VGFGRAARVAAVKAKAGRLRRGEAGGLVDRARSLLPEDVAAQGMALRFAEMAKGNPAGAGIVLILAAGVAATLLRGRPRTADSTLGDG